MHCEKQSMKGQVELILRDREGRVVEHKKLHNIIVSAGKTLVANLFRGFEKKSVSHVAVGTGDAPAHTTDTELKSELKPRKPFDTNTFTEERCASVVLRSEDGRKEVLRVVAKNPGEKGNTLEIKITKGRGKTVDISVRDSKLGDADAEFFSALDLNPESTRYLPKFITDNSKFVDAFLLTEQLPAVIDGWVRLEGGSDAVVTLSATFDYGDCNGLLREAGIFNAEEKGTLYNRVVFPEINKTDRLTLTLIWRITF